MVSLMSVSIVKQMNAYMVVTEQGIFSINLLVSVKHLLMTQEGSIFWLVYKMRDSRLLEKVTEEK